jgi:prepilin signal peptidase PulO-like enzyme (type II secretory pathway)
MMTPDFAERILLIFAAGMLGASVGSFVNVCIYRWPKGLSVSSPSRSFCPCCKEPIRALDNIPVFSWLWLRGRCRTCNAAIPISYFLTELLSGVGAALAFAKYGWIAALCFTIDFALLCTLLRSTRDGTAVRLHALFFLVLATCAMLAAQGWHRVLSYPFETLSLGLIIGIWVGGQRRAGWLPCLVCICAGFAAGPPGMALSILVLGGLNLWFAQSAQYPLYVDYALLSAVCLQPLFR